MNYHIAVQDKFMDSFIEDVYDLGLENNNVFWLRGEKGDSTYVQTTRAVEYIGENPTHIRNRFKQLQPDDQLFIHWYDTWMAELVFDLPNHISVIAWGGEFFGEPILAHRHWLFDALTLDFELRERKLNIVPRLNLWAWFKQVRRVQGVFREANRQLERRQTHVARIDTLILAEHNIGDLEKIKTLYPQCRAEHRPGFYDLNADLGATLPHIERDTTQPLKLLLGNSATSTNNHLDAFQQLKSIPNLHIYCPLSYGNSNYREHIITQGKALFQDRFIPITQFMSRSEYLTFLNSMDMVMMYHNRSQAFGNLISALALGKLVLVKSQNSLHQTFDALQLFHAPAEKIGQLPLETLLEEAQSAKKSNQHLVQAAFSRSKRLHDWKNALQ